MRQERDDPLSSGSAGAFLQAVEEELRALLGRSRNEMATLAPEAAVLVDEVARLVEAGGKRIRPLFTYWGYRAGGGEGIADIARMGAAVELLHTCALIHDDLIDRSETRRGQATAHRHLARGAGAEGERFGAAGAVLAGDLAEALAAGILADSGFPPDRLVPAFRMVSEMRVRAIGGEFLDLVAASTGGADPDSARRIAALKSGSYTVVGPLLAGATLAGASGEVLEALASYGDPLGEAFQLRDDVLSTFGDPELTGKDADADIREGKQTTLVALARETGEEEARRAIDSTLGRPGISDEEVAEARDAIRRSGALQASELVIRSLVEEARAALRTSPVPLAVAAELDALASSIASPRA